MPAHRNIFNVIVMDDDNFALLWIYYLLSRDPRTRVLAVYKDAVELLGALQGVIYPDAILIDAEYRPDRPQLADLIDEVANIQTAGRIVCLSQYGSSELVRAAIRAGASGFLIKNEIGLALASAVTLACQGDFVATPGTVEAAQAELLPGHARIRCLPRWSPNPEFTPQLFISFCLRVLFGMRAQISADEIGVKPGTVEKYVFLAYQKLSSRQPDEIYLGGVDIDELPAEERAFLLYTIPPQQEQER